MALAFDSVLNQATQNVTTSTNTFSFTNTAGNGLLVGIWWRNTSNAITSVTWNGSTMTQAIAPINTLSNTWVYLYYLNSPSTGVQNLVVTNTQTGTDLKVTAVTYSGSNTTSSFINATNSGTGSSTTTATGTITPTTSNCWGVLLGVNDQNVNVAGVGSTARGTSGNPTFFDSNGTILSGLPNAMSYSWTGVGNYCWITTAIASSGGGGAAVLPSLSLLGVGN